VSKIDAKYQ